MDRLTIEFCFIIWVLCLSKTQAQIQLSNYTHPLCTNHQPIPPPDQCNTCICFDDLLYCTHLPCLEQQCIGDVDLPRPDECNQCVCQQGKVECTNLYCIPAPQCEEKKVYPTKSSCNSCMCLNGFIMCTNNNCDHEYLEPPIPGIQQTPMNIECYDDVPLVEPNECVKCTCYKGIKSCVFTCEVPSRIKEPECVSGEHIPQPDKCNKCICFEGEIHCTNMPCRREMQIGPECDDNQPVYRPDECNECYCFEGRLECSDLVCIRGSKCFEGEEIPKPDSCNVCRCFEGHILCTDYQCANAISKVSLTEAENSSKEVLPLEECKPGDDIPPPPPPNDCNTCVCTNNRIVCTTKSCVDSVPEINGRLTEQNEETNPDSFDNQISVNPLMNILFKNSDRLSSKLIHTHDYNGFRQEIELRSNRLPQHATKLLKALAHSLNGPALVSISNKITSSDPNNHTSKTPLFQQVIDQSHLLITPLNDKNISTNQMDSSAIYFTESSKLLTSGPQSNETTLVVPSEEPLVYQNSQSMLPIISHHKTSLNPVASSAAVNKNIHPIFPDISEEEKLQDYYDDNSPAVNPSKLGHDAFHYLLPTSPTQYSAEILNRNVPSSNPPVQINSEPIKINNGKTSHAELFPDNNQFKQISSENVPNLQSNQLTKPNNTYFFNYTFTYPEFKPDQIVVPPNVNIGQHNQSPLEPNLSMFYSNPLQPQQSQKQPYLTLYPPQFQNHPNATHFSVNLYKPPQLELNSDKNNPLLKLHSVYQIHPPFNKPSEKKHIHITENLISKEIHPKFKPNSTPRIQHDTKISFLPQNGVQYEYNLSPLYPQFDPMSQSLEFEERPNQEQHKPHSIISYAYTQHKKPTSTDFRPIKEKNIPPYNKGTPHDTTHSRVTYVLKYDHPQSDFSIDQASPSLVGLSQHHNPTDNFVQNNLPKPLKPDQGSNEFDSTISKVNYLNLPNVAIDPHMKKLKLIQHYPSHTSFNFDYTPSAALNTHDKIFKTDQNQSDPTKHSSPNILINYSHNPIQSKFKLHQDQEVLYDDGSSNVSPNLAHLSKRPTTLKLNQNQRPYHFHLGPSQYQHTPELYDNREPAESSQLYITNSAENPFPSKVSLHKSPQFRPNQNIPQYTTDSVSNVNGHQKHNPSEDPTRPKTNLYISPSSQVMALQSQQMPLIFDDLGSTEGFQHPINSDEDITHIHIYSPQHQYIPGVFKDSESADGFQYPSSSAIDPKYQTGALQLSPLKPLLNQHISEVSDGNGSGDDILNVSNSVEDSTHAKDNAPQLPRSQFGMLSNQLVSGVPNRGNIDYTNNPDRDLTHHNVNLHKLPQSQFSLKIPHSQPEQRVPDTHGFISAEDITHVKPSHSFIVQLQNLHMPGIPHAILKPLENQHMPKVFKDDFQYPSNSAQDIPNPKATKHNSAEAKYELSYNQPQLGVFDDHGDPNGIHYSISNSAKEPANLQNNHHEILVPQYNLDLNLPLSNQYGNVPIDYNNYGDPIEEMSFDKNKDSKLLSPKKPMEKITALLPNKSTDGQYNSRNPQTWIQPDHGQYKPSSIDSHLNEVHNIPWLAPDDHQTVTSTVTSNFKPRLKPDHDQYKQSSIDDIFNSIHQIPLPAPAQDTKYLNYNSEHTPPPSKLKPEQDQYKPLSIVYPDNIFHKNPLHLTEENTNSFNSNANPLTFKPNQDQYGHSVIENPLWSIPHLNVNTEISDVGKNEVHTEQNLLIPNMDFIDPGNNQYNLHNLLISPDTDSDYLLSFNDGKMPDNYDKLYPSLIAGKKLSELFPINASEYNDTMALLPLLSSPNAQSINYNTSPDQIGTPLVDNQGKVKSIFPWSKLKPNEKQLYSKDNGILNYLKKLIPIKYNTTKNDIGMNKIYNLLSKLPLQKMQNLQNVAYSSVSPETISYSVNDFQENVVTTTQYPPTEITVHTYENRFMTVPKVPEVNHYKATPNKYPDGHTMSHETYKFDDSSLAIPQYKEIDADSMPPDMSSEDLGALLFPKLLNPRFRYRPKDHKEECGEGTEWIVNCHGCSCQFGQAMCFKIPHCDLRPFGEPMTCKPYSQFKMGDCYVCECNGDGVAECDSTDCKTENDKNKGSTAIQPVKEFYDDKETNELIEYYNLYKKLPKDCPTTTVYPSCEPGTSWISSCHKCECDHSGQHKCSRIEGCELDSELYGKPSRCKPNTKFYPKTTSRPCVECLCNDEGIPYCPDDMNQ